MNTIAFRLEDAYLCECGLVVNSAMRCACGNEYGLLSLSAVLNRDSLAAELKGIMGVYAEVMQEAVCAL